MVASSTGLSGPEPCIPLCTAALLQERKNKSEHPASFAGITLTTSNTQGRQKLNFSKDQRHSNLLFGFIFCMYEGSKCKCSGS